MSQPSSDEVERFFVARRPRAAAHIRTRPPWNDAVRLRLSDIGAAQALHRVNSFALERRRRVCIAPLWKFHWASV